MIKGCNLPQNALITSDGEGFCVAHGVLLAGAIITMIAMAAMAAFGKHMGRLSASNEHLNLQVTNLQRQISETSSHLGSPPRLTPIPIDSNTTN